MVPHKSTETEKGRNFETDVKKGKGRGMIIESKDKRKIGSNHYSNLYARNGK